MRSLKLFILIPVMLLCVAATGPASCDRSVFDGGASLTASVRNPVGPVDLYRAKTVYAGTLELVSAWREYCWSRPYAVLMTDPVARPICQSRRPILRAVQSADDKAFAALKTAENFVRDNPTVSAVSAIQSAMLAVAGFNSLVSQQAAVVR